MNRIFISLATLLLLSCGAGKNAQQTNEADYTNESSIITFETLSLQLINLQIGETLHKVKDVEISLYIDVQGKSYSGRSGCNSYFGTLELVNEDQIKFLPGGQTEMMCEEGIMAWESRYLNALFDKPFSVTDRTANATLYAEDGKVILTFVKVNSVSE